MGAELTQERQDLPSQERTSGLTCLASHCKCYRIVPGQHRTSIRKCFSVQNCRINQQEDDREALFPRPKIALVTQPVIGIMGLFSVVFFENGDFTPPPFGSLLLFSLGVIGILVTELRLIELTSALTLAVLSAAHNVIMVVFFLCLDGEGGDISFTQGLGYAVNTVGCFLYAGVRYLQKQEEARLEMETNQYHATLLPSTIPEDRTSPPIVERN